MRYFIALTLSASFDSLKPRDSHIYVTMDTVVIVYFDFKTDFRQKSIG